MWFLSQEWAKLFRDHVASPFISQMGKQRPRQAKGPPKLIWSNSTSPCLGLGFQDEGRLLLSQEARSL